MYEVRSGVETGDRRRDGVDHTLTQPSHITVFVGTWYVNTFRSIALARLPRCVSRCRNLGNSAPPRSLAAWLHQGRTQSTSPPFPAP
jgi:hypothetical protein